MYTLIRSVVVLLCLCLSVPAIASAQANIPDQQGVKRYGLSNGLEVIFVPTDRYGDQQLEASLSEDLQIWLVIRSGTMDEGNGEDSAANVAESFVRQGGIGVDEQFLDELLNPRHDAQDQRRQERGSFVFLDQTIYTGSIQANDPAQARELLSFYTRLLDPKQWQADSQIFASAQQCLKTKINEFMRPELQARQRWLPKLLGDGRLGQRLGFPEPEQIDALSLQRCLSFADRTYRPSRATLIVVGRPNALNLDPMIAGTLGRLPMRPSGKAADLRVGLEANPFVVAHHPELTKHTSALVWANPNSNACLESWSICSGQYTENDLRDYIINRVAGELIRHRLDRLLVANLGSGIETSIDQFSLAGQVDLIQCVIEREGDAWVESTQALLNECNRLAELGAAEEEITRARAALLAQWHRGADDWLTMSDRRRAWRIKWMVTDARPIIDPIQWDQRATATMATISNQEILSAITTMLDPDRAQLLAVTKGDPQTEADMQRTLQAIRVQNTKREVIPLDPNWMRDLGGDIFDDHDFKGRISSISQHPQSQTWSASLENGIDLWAMPLASDPDDRFSVCATLWGPMFSDGSLGEDEISAALTAWRTPSSESRSTRWLAVYVESHQIKIIARRIVGGIQLQISAPNTEAQAAVGLLHVLLQHPLIDDQAFKAWQDRHQHDHGHRDMLDHAFAMLYRPEIAERPRETPLSIDDAQRTLTRIVRNAQVGIAMAGNFNPSEQLENASKVLGQLVRRPALSTPKAEVQGTTQVTLREKTIKLEDPRAKQDYIIIGTTEEKMPDIQQLRATVLATVVLKNEARELAHNAGHSIDIDAQVVSSEALVDGYALIIRGYGNTSADAASFLKETAQRISAEGINQDQLRPVQKELVESITAYFGRSSYWSNRLSMLAKRDSTIDELWTIREGYQSVDAQMATEALRHALGAPDRFVITIQAQGEQE